MLKIVATPPGGGEAVPHLFHFNSSSNAQGEADLMKDVLSNLISAHKANASATGTPAPEANGVPAAMAIANALAPKANPGAMPWYEDSQLRSDVELQQSLLKKEPALQQTYLEARRMKPDTITDSQFNTQFWLNRINLLRAHAVETHQTKGQYNVLAGMKPRSVDGELKLNISNEQIKLIFDQHPLVRRVYDENVPKLTMEQFWSKFFLSKLFKRLKGERYSEVDGIDPIFDKYLTANIDGNLNDRLDSLRVPHTIDLEGNEENQGGAKSGNRKDWTMRPSSHDKAPIIRTLNNLSLKMMSNVAPSDIDPSAPIGTDEKTFNKLALRDLEADGEESRIKLSIQEQSRFFSNEDALLSNEAKIYKSQDPVELISGFQDDISYRRFRNPAGGLNLQAAIGVDDDSDIENEESQPHVGSTRSRDIAQQQITEGVKQRLAQLDESGGQSGLTEATFGRLVLTNQTTNSFLNSFWSAYLSGDPDRAEELAALANTLERSLERIKAVADDAEKDKEVLIAAEKQKIRETYAKSGKKLPWNPHLIPGGSQVVYEMVAPTTKAVNKAIAMYNEALAEAQRIEPK